MTDSPQPDPAKEPSTEKPSFFAELKRRKVMRVAITYAIVAWLIIQVASATFGWFDIPAWAFRFVTIMLILGFPVALIITWAFELTPDGVKLTKNVSEEQKASTSQSKRNWMTLGFAAALPTVIFGVLAVFFYFKVERVSTEMEEVVAAQQEAPEKSIAVLPFDNRSNLEEDQFFTDGIHDDLLTQISRIRDIKTISRTSVMAYRDTTKNMREIGEELGVAHLLEGGVQRAGDRVRINMQLIDAQTDAHLWAETYTRELTAANVFEIQSEIAVAIADALAAVLSPEEQEQLNKLPTENLAALEAFFQGRRKALSGIGEELSEAIGDYKRAIELDPDFALAYVALAAAYITQVWTDGLPADGQSALALPLIEKALELDPRLSGAYGTLGFIYARAGDIEKAGEAFRRSIELNPNSADAHLWFGHFKIWYLGDVAGSLAQYEKAYALDPKNLGVLQQYAEALMVDGQFEASERMLAILFEEDPDYVEGWRAYAELQGYGFGRFDERIKAYHRLLSLGGDNPNFLVRLADSYLTIGMYDDSVAVLELAKALYPKSDDVPLFDHWISHLRGDKVAALEHFREIPEETDFYGLSQYLASLYLLESGRPDEALEIYRSYTDATEINQENVTQFGDKIRLLVLVGEDVRARGLARKVLAATPRLSRMGPNGYWTSETIAWIALGEYDNAVDAFSKLVEAGYTEDPIGGTDVFEPLRSDPNFVELMDRMVARAARQRANVERWKASGELEPLPEIPEN